MADRIISLDETRLLGYFRALGMEDEVVDAVEKRLKKVKELLKRDRDKGFRNKFEEYIAKTDPKKKNYLEHAYIIKREMLVRESNHTDIHKGLIQDVGVWDSDALKKINVIRKDSVILKSVKPIFDKFHQLKDALNADKAKIAELAPKKETLDVLKEIENYCDCDFDWENLETQSIHSES